MNDFSGLGHTVMLPPPAPPAGGEPPCEKLVQRLLEQNIVLLEDWEALPNRVQRRIIECREEPKAIEHLVKHGLLTRYQAQRIEAGTIFGLVLGSYRLLERLGAGGMAVVFKAEHSDLRHHVAVKVLPPTTKDDFALESRFFAEMRIVARLRHPNIVAATDAGRVANDDSNTVIRYLVMEYVPGQDLEDVVRKNGPMAQARACAIAYQMASALGETHKYGLVHRDIKPSNIMLTAEDQAKLLDFGLTRHFGNRMTMPGTILGTIDYMAPEQARDASTVDIRADIYGLGGTLYWLLTGKVPFPFHGNPVEALTRRLTAPAPSLRAVCPEMPANLEAVVAKMMALRPEERYPDPQSVMQALLPFVKAGGVDTDSRTADSVIRPSHSSSMLGSRAIEKARILIIDDETPVRELCKQLLEAEGATVETAANGPQGLVATARGDYDIVLLDIAMPEMNGQEVLRRLREQGRGQLPKVIVFSGHMTPEEMSQMLTEGADDFLTKPFSVAQLLARIQNVVRLKMAQERASGLSKQVMSLNSELEQSLKSQSGDVVEVRNGLVLALARMMEQREGRTPGHIHRMQRYCRKLAEAAAASPLFQGQIDANFIELLECCAPLHDIGKVGLPDHILQKVGVLTHEERCIMETHTVIAADALKEIAQEHGSALAFLQMAIEITRHHHERYDGAGYPDRLEGDAIPLSARIVAVADVYDALRCRRQYKPALPHPAAVQIIMQNSPGQFDPHLLEVFQQAASSFETVFRELPD